MLLYFFDYISTPRECDEWTDILLKTLEEQERKQGLCLFFSLLFVNLVRLCEG